MYPENDELCASIISQVIAKTKTKTNDDSRAASSTFDVTTNRDRNQIYALRQKMFGPYIAKTRTNAKNESRAASIVNEPIRNKIFALRQVMFGRWSK